MNPLALEEFAALQERLTFLTTQLDDLKATRKDLMTVVADVDARIQEVFAAAYADTAREFEQVFAVLFPGGEGRLVLTEPDDMLVTGIEVEARPPGKKVKRLSLLSGGERSLTAIALLVAIFRARPSPFYVMDEVEAALDDVNLGRLLTLVESLRETSPAHHHHPPEADDGDRRRALRREHARRRHHRRDQPAAARAGAGAAASRAEARGRRRPAEAVDARARPGRSAAAHEHPGVGEPAGLQRLLGQPEAQPAVVAPDHPGGVVAVDLQQQLPARAGRPRRRDPVAGVGSRRPPSRRPRAIGSWPSAGQPSSWCRLRPVAAA